MVYRLTVGIAQEVSELLEVLVILAVDVAILTSCANLSSVDQDLSCIGSVCNTIVVYIALYTDVYSGFRLWSA